MANVPPVPGTTFAPPPGTMVGNVPPAPGTVVPVGTTAGNVPPVPVSTVGNVKPPKEVWDTNHPKSKPPATTMANVPTAPPGSTMPNVMPMGDPSSGGGVVPLPIGTAANVPPGATVVPTGAPGGGVMPVVSDPSKGSRKSVRWDSHIPGKNVIAPPSKTPPPPK